MSFPLTLQGSAISHSLQEKHTGVCAAPACLGPFINELDDGLDGMMIKSPYVSRLGGSADTFENRIKIPKALRELEEESKKRRTEFNKKASKDGSLGRISCTNRGSGRAGTERMPSCHRMPRRAHPGLEPHARLPH